MEERGGARWKGWRGGRAWRGGRVWRGTVEGRGGVRGRGGVEERVAPDASSTPCRHDGDNTSQHAVQLWTLVTPTACTCRSTGWRSCRRSRNCSTTPPQSPCPAPPSGRSCSRSLPEDRRGRPGSASGGACSATPSAGGLPAGSGTYVAHREDGEYRLHRPRRSEQVSDGPFGAADVDVRRPLLPLFPQHQPLDRPVLRRVAERRRRRVGVDVVDRTGRQPGMLQGTLHREEGAFAILTWRRHVVGVGRQPVALQLRVDARPACFRMFQLLRGLLASLRSWVCWADMVTSNTTMPAPSPMTKPARDLSNGLDAECGLSFQSVARLLARAKPAIASGWMQDSAPPATITSASPRVMKRAASPMA